MATKQNDTLQNRFFKKLRDLLPSNISMVEDIAEILEISTDSAYRRIRGETALTMDEISILCKKYNVSIDMFNPNEEGHVTFKYSPMHSTSDYQFYLQSILNQVDNINQAKSKHIIYSAVDIPIFHYFKYPELSAFKMFYWLKSIVNEVSLQGKKFRPTEISDELIEIGKKIYETYSLIPSTEIWAESTINGYLSQIEFYWDSGNFENKEDALLICEQSLVMLETLEKQAECGSKLLQISNTKEHQFLFYNSEIEIGNNCIYLSIGDTNYVYLSLHTFMATTNARFCHETKVWLDNLIKQSILISGVSQKQRYQFFRKIFDKVNILIIKIKEN